MKRYLAPLCVFLIGSLQAETGFFLSNNISQTKDDLDGATGKELSLGLDFGYKFNSNLKLKVGYQNFGEKQRSYVSSENSDADYNNTRIGKQEQKIKQADISIVYSYPVLESFNINIEYGYYQRQYENTYSFFTQREHINTGDTALIDGFMRVQNQKDDNTFYGVGLSYRVDKIELGLGLTKYEHGEFASEETSLSISYLF